MMYKDCTTDVLPCQRTCRKCGATKPVDQFTKSTYKPKRKQTDGYRNYCLECDKARYQPVTKTIPDGYKRCARKDACIHPEGPMLPRTPEYFYARQRKDGTVDYAMCRVCELAHIKVKRETPEYLESRSQKEARRQERERLRDEKKNAPKPALLTPEERKERNRLREKTPKRRAEHAQYIKTPKGKTNQKIAAQRRRSKLLNIPESFTVADWERAINYFDGCAACGRPGYESDKDYTLAPDHWIPVSSPHCPGTIVTNIVPLCHGIDGCNNSKHNYMPNEWTARRFGEQKASEIEHRIAEYFSTCSVL